MDVIENLTEGYAVDSSIKNIVDTRYIVFIPMLNPDGVVENVRYNSNYVDLNRNFSTEFTPGGDHGTSAFSEPESVNDVLESIWRARRQLAETTP